MFPLEPAVPVLGFNDPPFLSRLRPRAWLEASTYTQCLPQ